MTRNRNHKRKRRAAAADGTDESAAPSTEDTASAERATAGTAEPPAKKTRTFDERWDTAVNTPEEVLGP